MEHLVIHNGMVGHWKHYSFFRDIGSQVQPHEPLHAFPKVFVPIGAGECAHFSWSIDYIEQDRWGRKPFSEWVPAEATIDNPKEYGVTLHVSCDTCGLYGTLSLALSNKWLREDHTYIDWFDLRSETRLVMIDTGYGKWKEQQNAT